MDHSNIPNHVSGEAPISDTSSINNPLTWFAMKEVVVTFPSARLETMAPLSLTVTIVPFTIVAWSPPFIVVPALTRFPAASTKKIKVYEGNSTARLGWAEHTTGSKGVERQIWGTCTWTSMIFRIDFITRFLWSPYSRLKGHEFKRDL